MGLVVLKNWLFGKPSDDKRALLPIARSYETVNTNIQDDDATSDTSSESTSTLSEGSFVAPRVLSDVIIGLSDGLTVPFALTAGLSSLGNSKLVITGGLAELVSGAISMGLGGYLAAVGESEYYQAQLKKEQQVYQNSPYTTMDSLHQVLSEFRLSESTIKSFVQDLEKSPEELIHFILRIGKGLEEPADSRQFTSALTIGMSYFIGGFIPLIPYFFTQTVEAGLIISAIVMGVTLFLFGSIKTVVSIGTDSASKAKIVGDGFKMMLIGGVAAACAWGLVRAIDN